MEWHKTRLYVDFFLLLLLVGFSGFFLVRSLKDLRATWIKLSAYASASGGSTKKSETASHSEKPTTDGTKKTEVSTSHSSTSPANGQAEEPQKEVVQVVDHSASQDSPKSEPKSNEVTQSAKPTESTTTNTKNHERKDEEDA